MRDVMIVAGTVGLAAAHFLWHTPAVAYRLWEASAGIQTEGQVTAFGVTDRAWTVPAHLPAGVLFCVGLAPVGLLLTLAGSLAAGYGAASLAAELVGCGRPRLGTRAWRLWLTVAGWVWVPSLRV